MEQLLKAGADPNIRGLWENNTPLHMAATAGWMFGVRLLLKFNASIDPVDAFHFETPLHKAARHCNVRVCEILCEYGADTKRKNVDGQNYQDIMECARRYPDEWELDPELVYFLCA